MLSSANRRSATLYMRRPTKLDKKGRARNPPSLMWSNSSSRSVFGSTSTISSAMQRRKPTSSGEYLSNLCSRAPHLSHTRARHNISLISNWLVASIGASHLRTGTAWRALVIMRSILVRVGTAPRHEHNRSDQTAATTQSVAFSHSKRCQTRAHSHPPLSLPSQIGIAARHRSTGAPHLH